MNVRSTAFRLFCAFGFTVGASALFAQTPPPKPFEPSYGMAGKDVVWIPSPPESVELMLDMAQVTPRDFVIDLGSGDGRNVIAAARRGARALGVEYNPDLVEFSKRAAEKAGVADKAIFVQGDMYVADISQATALVLFLIPANLTKLMQKFLDLKAGTRIVANTFPLGGGWEPDDTKNLSECSKWCDLFLYIVPAKVAGTWRLPQGQLTLEQEFQRISGTLDINGTSRPVENGLLRGDEIHFTVDSVHYSGRVSGDSMAGLVNGPTTGTWTAKRAQQPRAKSDARYQAPSRAASL